MEDYNSKILEAASDLAHIATREMKDISDDEMWIDDEEGGLKYPENIQDLFNEFYDSFEVQLKSIFKEPKVYVIDTELIKEDYLLPHNDLFEKKQFVNKAESEGRVYSLQGFVDAFNANDELNQNTDYAIID